MPRYAITEKAGRFVAGRNNIGAGSVLNLTEKQAAHEVRLGTLRLLDLQRPDDQPKAKPSAQAGHVETIDLNDMTVAELRAMADKQGLDLASDLRKAEIIEAILVASA